MGDEERVLTKPILVSRAETFEGKALACDIALNWAVASFTERLRSYVNVIRTADGGAHEEGFRKAITGTINRWGQQDEAFAKADPQLTGDDLREGLVAVISVKMPDPQFEGQTKGKLGSAVMRRFVEKTVNEDAAALAGGQPHARPTRREEGDGRGPGPRGRPRGPRAHATQGHPRRHQRRAPRQAGRLLLTQPRGVRALTSSRATPPAARPSWPATATTRPSSRCAARSSTSRRPSSRKVLANAEIGNLIKAVGTGVGDDFDYARLRYHKVITCCRR